MEYIQAINSLLFPSKNLCYLCRENLDKIKNFICDDCYGLLEVVDRELDIDSETIEKAYYSLMYNKFIREKIADFKFNKKSYLYKPFGELMIRTMEKKKIRDVDLILYIPSHRRKEAIRGYNQSQLLAQYISKSLNIPISNNNLVKIRHTMDQSKLDRYAREGNLKDAFKIKRKEEIYNKKILLVDDIITTGSTMIECANVLIKNEARQVIGLALTSSRRL